MVKRCEAVYEQQRQHHPDMEPHELLGHLWQNTRRTRCRAKDPALHKPAFVATYFYACVPPLDGARALALWIVLSRRFAFAGKDPSLEKEYCRIMAPVFEAQRNGELHALYAKHNPRLSADIQWESK